VLAKRVIPTILSRNGQLVKGVGFSADRVVGNALQSARIHAMRGVDEIVLLDVTATHEKKDPDYDMVRRLSDGCFAPLTVGGGVETEEHVRELLKAGADKILMGYSKISKVPALALKYGRQCITVSLDVTRNNMVAEYAKDIEKHGAGEILLQSIPRDGTMAGYDLPLIRAVSEAVNIPVVASGGCGTPEHALEAINAGADGVAVGAMFLFTSETPRSLAEYLHKNNIEVRI